MQASSAPERGRVLLIAAHNSYRIVPYLAAARRIGVDLLIASEGEHSLISELAEGVRIDLHQLDSSLASLLAAAEVKPFSGVIASDDVCVQLGSRVAGALSLPHNPPAAAELTRRKDLARARLLAAGVPVPEHRLIDLFRPLAEQIAESQLRFPCVIKPLALSASRGVIRANDRDQLARACERVRAILVDQADPMERTQALLEDYIPGREIAVEGLLDGGKLHILAIFDKPEPLTGPYFEETYYITPTRLSAEVKQRVRRRVTQACAAYGLREGPIHAELRINSAGLWILEVASRTIGGQCARLLQFGAGSSLEDLVLKQAMGAPWRITLPEGAAGVLMIPIPAGGILQRVEGVLKASKLAYIEEVEISVREGYELTPLPEGASYLGFIFARAPTPEQAEAALRRAHGCLKVVTTPLIRLHRATD